MKVDEKRRKVRKLVDRLALSRIQSFMADYVAKQLYINNAEAENFLNELTIKEAPLLNLNYKFICPNCGFVRRFTKLSELIRFKEEQGKCPFCDVNLSENLIDMNIYNIYVFDEEYREKRKKCELRYRLHQ